MNCNSKSIGVWMINPKDLKADMSIKRPYGQYKRIAFFQKHGDDWREVDLWQEGESIFQSDDKKA